MVAFVHPGTGVGLAHFRTSRSNIKKKVFFKPCTSWEIVVERGHKSDSKVTEFRERI